MKLLDRYIANRILKIYLLGQIAFLCLFIFVDVFINFGKIQPTGDESKYLTIVKYYAVFLPSLFNMSSCFVFTLACFFALAQLERNSQLVAIHASTISVYRVITLLLSMALVFGAFQIFNNCYVIPKASKSQIVNRWSSLKVNPDNPISYRDPLVHWKGLEKNFNYSKGESQFHIEGVDLESKSFASIQAILLDKNLKPFLKVMGSSGTWNEEGMVTIQNSILYGYDMQRDLSAYPSKQNLKWHSDIPLESLYFSRFSKQSLTYSELTRFNHDVEFKNERFHRIADGLLPFLLITICSITALPLIYIKPIFAYFSCLITTLMSYMSYTALKGVFEDENLGYIYPIFALIIVSLGLFVWRSKKIPS